MLAYLIDCWSEKVTSLFKRVKSEALYKNNRCGAVLSSQYVVLVLIMSRLEVLCNSRSRKKKFLVVFESKHTKVNHQNNSHSNNRF